MTQFNSQPDAFDYTKLFEDIQTSLHSHVYTMYREERWDC